MTGNIIDYVNQFQYDFTQRELNDVDSLVLCQLSYLKMKGIVPGLEAEEDFVPFRTVVSKKNHDKVFADERYREDNEKLAKALLRSKRYENLKVNYYVDILDKEMEIQFSAVTFYLGMAEDKELYYIAYRGTDENLVGWKEDFTLAFSEPVVGQLYAARYMRKATAYLPEAFYMGGHSKGGNLAVFAAMSSGTALQERIRRVYCHDGPGFKPEVMERYEYERIEEKVEKILPSSSMVGMLLEHGMNFQVVESSSRGLMQHNPYTWTVELEQGAFLQAERLKDGMRVMDNAITDWILSLDDGQLEKLSDVLFRIIGGSEADNLIDLRADWKKSVSGILQEMKVTDDKTKEELEDIIKELFEITKQTTKREWQSKIEDGIRRMQKKLSIEYY